MGSYCRKQKLRKQIHYYLLQNSIQSKREVVSKQLCNNVEKHSLFVSHERIGVYIPMKDEVDIHPLITQYISKKTIMLPRIEGNTMRFVRFDSWDNLEKGKFGIYTPKILLNENNEQPTLLLVPALAFDNDNYRLGRGGGYYDKYIKDTKVLSIGLSLIKQQSTIYRDFWDIPMDDVITP